MGKTKEQISLNMKAVKNKDSQIELLLRKELWSRGLRYRKNSNKVFGHPDIVFIGKKVAVFCDSEFWHGYNWETQKFTIKSNREFWIQKIESNIQRDRDCDDQLIEMGWLPLHFWEHQINKNLDSCIKEILSYIPREFPITIKQ